ncbi:MAG: hypothetical protein KBS82_07600 [Oscillospiraceae bacterium]|nr:hypothetical protein [Candidatus Limimonas egerieequi]
MKRTYKNVDGKGNVTYVEYEIAEPVEEPPTPKRLEDMTKEELIEFITQGGSY